MADVKVRIIGEDQASRTLQGFDRTFTEMKAKFDTLKFAASTFSDTFKKVFELGAEGAVVLQTAESFDLLLEKVGAAPDLLDQLRKASKGTVPDMQLMSQTAKLLAGASGDLASSMAKNAPEILNIAKAANKLNPSLGDTSFLYESLMTGIKRGSPMWIDNTGLVIKLGEANQKYADSLGKSVEALTADEQKQALLNATLEAGATMIDQVGGNTDSATDAIAQMDTATKNLFDSLKAKLAPGISKAARAITILITATDRMNEALDNSIPILAAQSKSWDDYSSAAARMIKSTGLIVKVQEDQIKVFEATPFGLIEVTDRFDLLTKAQYENTKSTDDVTQAYLAWVQTTKLASDASNDFAARLAGIADKEKIVKEAVKETSSTIISGAEANKWAAGYAELAAAKHISYKDAVKDLKDEEMKRLENLHKLREAEKTRLAQQVTEVAVAGQLASIYKTYTSTIRTAVESNAELVAEYKELITSGKGTEEQFKRIRDAISANNQTQREALETMKKTTAEMIYQKASQGLSAESALVLARGLGLVSQEDYKLITQLQALRAQFDSNRDGMIDASEGAAEYTQKVIELYNATVKAKEGLIQMQAALNMPAGGGGTGGGGMQVGAGMVDLGGGIFQYTAPGSTTMSNPAGGIYVGGAGETIGPGASTPVTVNYTNNGVDLTNAAELQRLLTPIVQNIIAGR